MNKFLSRFTLLSIAILTIWTNGYTQKKLLILGSSTSACWGPTLPANCYLNRLTSFYNNLTPTITIENRAAAGFNVYKSMPRAYNPPPGRDSALPYYSITDALNANPDIILINYPSNNYENYTVAEVMFCLRTIKAAANKSGKPCFITTTQPRTSFNASGREKLMILKDSILQQFGPSAIDFWTEIADPVSLDIATPYKVAGDPVHLNDSAHYLLYQRVLAKNILHTVLPDAGADLAITLPYGGFLDGRNSVASSAITSYTWSKVAGPASFNLVNPASASSYINSLSVGTYTFRLTVKDDKGISASDDVTVIVKEGAVSPPPITLAGSDITINIPVASVFLDGSKSSAPGSSIRSFKWTYIAGPAGSNILTPIASSTTINGLVQGSYTFRLTVTNLSGISSYDEVVITVNPVGGLITPVALAGKDETIPVGQSTVLHGENSTAPGGSIKSYLWSKYSGPPEFQILTPAVCSTWVRNMVAGIYIYRLTITDNNGLTSFDDVVITVTPAGTSPVPQSPVAQAGTDQVVTLPVSGITVNASGSTAPGSFITKYLWNYISGPLSYNIQAPQSMSTTITNLAEGVYNFQLTVTNSAGLNASDNLVITVKPSPVTTTLLANAGKDETIPAGQSTVLRGEMSTAPGSSIKSYLWTKFSGPSTYEILSPAGSSTWIRNLVSGSYVFRLTITDLSGATASDDVAIIVLTAPLPVAIAGIDQQLILPTSIATLDGRKSGTPAGKITKYNWKYVSGPPGSLIISPDSAITKVNGLENGIYVFRLTVTNSLSGNAYDDLMVTVSGTSVPPVTTTIANAGKDETIPVGQATVLHGERSTVVNGKIISYTWTKYAGPLSLEMLTPTAATTWIRYLEAGNYVFRLTIKDDKGNIATDDVLINVIPLQSLRGRNQSLELEANNNSGLLSHNALTLYPNPAINNVTVSLNAEVKGEGKIYITNAAGTLIKVVSISKDQQLFTKQLDLSSMKQGNYAIEVIVSGQRIAIEKFFKY